MKNETNLWSIFLLKTTYWQNFDFKGLNYHNFKFLIITNLKTERYLNNFQEHLVGILRLRKYQSHFKISFPHQNEAIKHDLVEFN